MTVSIRADRTLVVAPISARSCLYPVQTVYAVNPRVLQVYLSDDVVDDCARSTDKHPSGGSRAPAGAAARYRIPESIDLDHVAFTHVVGPLAFYPRYRVVNALAVPPD